MANKTVVQREIKEYCELNGISDIDAFMWKCTVQGFNIIKYGVSPGDNVRREEEVSRKKVGRPKKTETKKSDAEPQEEKKEVKVTKRKIKIVSND